MACATATMPASLYQDEAISQRGELNAVSAGRSGGTVRGC
jgi:hypothetical protein